MTIFDKLYVHEINWHVSAFWDAGISVKLGDEMNGYLSEGTVGTFDEAEGWLEDEARKHYPTLFRAAADEISGIREDLAALAQQADKEGV